MAKSKADALNAMLAEASQKSGEVSALLAKAEGLSQSLVTAGQTKAKKAGERWESFAQWVRSKLEEHNLSTEALATAADLPYSSIRGYLSNNARTPSVSVAVRIAKVFEADANDFYAISEFFDD